MGSAAGKVVVYHWFTFDSALAKDRSIQIRTVLHGSGVMLYRVLYFALLCSGPAALSAATISQESVTHGQMAEGGELAAMLYGFRATGEAVPHPMSDADGNQMWDALGGGCVDGGSWDEPFPAGKGDVRSAAFCIPQPCVRLLAPEELAREVVGRRLEEGEYQTYLQRLEETCGEMPSPPAAAHSDLLLASLDGFELVSASGQDPLEAPELVRGIAGFTAATGAFQWVRPEGGRNGGGFRSAEFRHPFGGGARTSRYNSHSGDRSAPERATRTPKPDIVSPPSKFEPNPTPGGDPEPPAPNIPQQPAPVPLPGGLAMLLTALAAFAVRKRWL